MDEFLSYQSFANAEVAQGLLSLLRHHHLVYETALDEPVFSLNMAYNPTDTRFVVRLRADDFEAARQLEDELNQHLTASPASDHYLVSFTDEELFDILVKADEWNSYDVTLASQLLRQRGRDVSADTVRLLRQHRIDELAKPEPTQKTWIVAGYLFAVCGGIMGMLIGWHLHHHKKTLPNGTQVRAFSARDRVHGYRILILGIVGLFTSILLRIMPNL